MRELTNGSDVRTSARTIVQSTGGSCIELAGISGVETKRKGDASTDWNVGGRWVDRKGRV